MDLPTTVREELARNTHDGTEDDLRCTCSECIEALAEAGIRVVDAARIRKVFKELDEAAYRLPIPKEWLSHPDVEAFSLAKHHMHVLLHEIASGGGSTPAGYGRNDSEGGE